MDYNNIKSFKDACNKLGISSELPEFPIVQEAEQRSLVAHYKLIIIAKALNEGWMPNWTDRTQVKYYPWPQYSAGVGFSFCDCAYSNTHSDVGSRLCYKSEELARYAFYQFKDIYNDFLQ